MSSHNLEYLNLELTPRQKSIKYEDFTLNCWAYDPKHSHSLHGSDAQQNTVVDLLLNLARSLEYYNKRYHNINTTIANSIGEKNKLIKQLTENIEYLKVTQNKLDKLFRGLNLTDLPLKLDIIRLSNLIESNKPRETETQSRLLLEQLKAQVELNKKHFDSEITRIQELILESKNW